MSLAIAVREFVVHAERVIPADDFGADSAGEGA
jgi:hypothetical protein